MCFKTPGFYIIHFVYLYTIREIHFKYLNILVFYNLSIVNINRILQEECYTVSMRIMKGKLNLNIQDNTNKYDCNLKLLSKICTLNIKGCSVHFIYSE